MTGEEAVKVLSVCVLSLTAPHTTGHTSTQMERIARALVKNEISIIKRECDAKLRMFDSDSQMMRFGTLNKKERLKRFSRVRFLIKKVVH